MIEITNINEKKIYFEETNSQFISTLEFGYIITPNEEFIKLKDDHGSSLTEFYSLYCEDYSSKFTTFEAIPILSKLGFIIYLGTNRNRSYSLSDDNAGFGIIFFNDEMTDYQKIAVWKLIDSNRGVINKNIEKIKLEFASGTDLKIKYNIEQVNEMLKLKHSSKNI